MSSRNSCTRVARAVVDGEVGPALAVLIVGDDALDGGFAEDGDGAERGVFAVADLERLALPRDVVEIHAEPVADRLGNGALLLAGEFVDRLHVFQQLALGFAARRVERFERRQRLDRAIWRPG